MRTRIGHIASAAGLVCAGVIGSFAIDAGRSDAAVERADGLRRELTTIELIDHPLAGTDWQLEAVIDDGETISDLPAPSTLSFDGNNRLSIEPGCNLGGSSVILGPNLFFVYDLSLTVMACEPAIMNLESQVLSVLDGIVFYQTEADQLTLGYGDLQLVYQPVD